MNRKLKNYFLLLALIMNLLAVGASPVAAQTTGSADTITLLQIYGSDVQLNGPNDSNTLTFGIPADWRLTSGATLDLSMSVSFNTAVAASGGVVAGSFGGGTLTVFLNKVLLSTYPVTQVGAVDLNLQIPPAALVSTRSDQRMELRFVLDSGISCYTDQQTLIVINGTSRFTLPHDNVLPDTDLTRFLYPLYQGSVNPDFAYVVIPDKPSAAEIRSALILASGLGNLTSSKLGLELRTISTLKPEERAAGDLIVVGKPSSLPLLANLPLPAPVATGKFQLAAVGGTDDDGVVQMVNSPWNAASVILVIGGNTDAGVVRAAQAVSTGVLRTNGIANLAVIQSVQEAILPPAALAEQTFADMGYQRQMFNRSGVSSAQYDFYIPAGSTISTDSYVDLAFGHSALLNYNLSGFNILINNQPVGSVRFSDTSAVQAVNHVQVEIPASVVIPGNNRLEVRASLEPLDVCTTPQLQGLWAVVWPESRLHLALGPTQFSTSAALSLATYPAPFIFDPTLGSLAFVLQKEAPSSWSDAFRMAAFLGDRTNGPLTNLNAFFADNLPEKDKGNYNFVMIGRPTKIPAISEISSALPAPFTKDSDMAIENNMQVKFAISPTAPIGYVELLPSPWNSDKVILAALGNTDQGVSWAAAALVDANLRSQLAGNFAVINGSQIVTADTRLMPAVVQTPVAAANAQQPLGQTDLTPPSEHTLPSWILPVWITSIVLVLIILVIVIVTTLARTRAKHKK